MSTHSFFRPPRPATWLLEMFAPYDQAESVLGDLHEEFSTLAFQHGPRAAHRWYWRQALKSVAKLAFVSLRTSPLSVTGAVIVGFVLLSFVPWLPEHAQFAILHLIRNHVTPYHADWYSYVFWINTSILAGQLLFCLFIGFLVGLLAKGSEIASTVLLSLLLILVTGVMLSAAHFVSPNLHPALLEVQLFMIDYPVMLILGGGIVRDIRLTRARKHSQA